MKRSIGVAAASLVGAAATLLGPLGAPAHAASCSGADGVTVIVDFAELGGGVTAGCADVADGARAAATVQAAGYSLTMATRAAGFVCRVNGAPASDPCVDASPADAYWSVWWADGKGGNWVYSSQGVASLRATSGGYIALAWHQGSGRSQPPSTVPVSRKVASPGSTTGKRETRTATSKASPKTTPKTTPKLEGTPSRKATGEGPSSEKGASSTVPPAGATAPSPRASAPTPATASVSASATASTLPAPSSTPTPGESVAVDPGLPSAADISAGPDSVAVESSGAEKDSLPLWAPIAVVLAVVAGGAAFVVARRRVG